MGTDGAHAPGDTDDLLPSPQRRRVPRDGARPDPPRRLGGLGRGLRDPAPRRERVREPGRPDPLLPDLRPGPAARGRRPAPPWPCLRRRPRPARGAGRGGELRGRGLGRAPGATGRAGPARRLGGGPGPRRRAAGGVVMSFVEQGPTRVYVAVCYGLV